MLKKTIFVNGIERRAVADPECSLLDFLRKQMSLSGVKEGHGACTVIVDGAAAVACGVKMKDLPNDARITTIEGIGAAGRLHPLQTSWLLHKAAKCGACAPGFIMSAKALLDCAPKPSKADVLAWFKANGNCCGLTCADTAAEAVLDAAKLSGGEAALEDLWLRRTGEAYSPGAELADAEAVAMVTGTYETGADIGLKLPEGALYASLVCPTASGAKVFSVDVSEAEKEPGVFKVITWKDVAGTNAIGTNNIGGVTKILNDRSVSGPCDAVAAVLGFTQAAASKAAGKVKAAIELEGAEEGACGGTAAGADDCCGTATGADECCGSAAAAQCRIPAVALAYLNDKGKLVIHTARRGLNASALEDAIGAGRGQLSLVGIAGPGPGLCGEAAGACPPAVEGVAGVAALAAGRPVYIEI